MKHGLDGLTEEILAVLEPFAQLCDLAEAVGDSAIRAVTYDELYAARELMNKLRRRAGKRNQEPKDEPL